MKTILVLSLVALSASAFANRCPQTGDISSRCDIQVTGYSLAECHQTAPSRYFPGGYQGDYPGTYPGNMPFPYNSPYHTHPWNRVEIGTEASSCDISLEDCKYFAFRQLDKFSYTNQCGATSEGKSVEYSYRSMNNDGTVADEVTGRMRK